MDAALLSQALSHHQAGRLAEAEALYRQALDADPDDADAHHYLGIAHFQRDELDDAEAALRRAIASQPGYAKAHSNLGNVLKAKGDLDGATAAFTEAVDAGADFGDAAFNRGVVLCERGRTEDAVDSFRIALETEPAHAAALQALEELIPALPDASQARIAFAEALARIGRPMDAEREIREALRRKPGLADAHGALGRILAGRSDFAAARTSFRKAVVIAPESAEFRDGLADSLRRMTPDAGDQYLAKDLEVCLAWEDGDALLFQAAVALLMKSGGDVLDACRQPFALSYLRQAHITDMELEQSLTTLRRELLLGERDLAEAGLTVLSALAGQCFVNEYVWFEEPDETEAVDALIERLSGGGASLDADDLTAAVIVAAYRPLGQVLPNLDETPLSGSADHDAAGRVIREQVTEPAREAQLRQGLRVFGPIEDSVSQAVQEQYEANPYPRWVGLTRQIPESLTAVMRRQTLNVAPDEISFPGEPKILYAGCGTGRQAVQSALRFPDAQITAIDLSRTSLAYAARTAEERGAGNMDFIQADIRELSGWEERFHIIESTGVIHHMADPEAAAGILTNLLETGGMMRLGLYSERARRAVVAGRALAANGNFDSRPGSIRRFRRTVARLQPHHAAAALRGAPDFYTLSACRDLVFHVEEHRFTLERVSKMLETHGLEFLGFTLADRSIRQQYAKLFPGDPAAVNLANWHTLEAANPTLFAGMYNFWVRRRAA